MMLNPSCWFLPVDEICEKVRLTVVQRCTRMKSEREEGLFVESRSLRPGADTGSPVVEKNQPLPSGFPESSLNENFPLIGLKKKRGQVLPAAPSGPTLPTLSGHRWTCPSGEMGNRLGPESQA